MSIDKRLLDAEKTVFTGFGVDPHKVFATLTAFSACDGSSPNASLAYVEQNVGLYSNSKFQWAGEKQTDCWHRALYNNNLNGPTSRVKDIMSKLRTWDPNGFWNRTEHPHACGRPSGLLDVQQHSPQRPTPIMRCGRHAQRDLRELQEHH